MFSAHSLPVSATSLLVLINCVFDVWNCDSHKLILSYIRSGLSEKRSWFLWRLSSYFMLLQEEQSEFHLSNPPHAIRDALQFALLVWPRCAATSGRGSGGRSTALQKVCYKQCVSLIRFCFTSVLETVLCCSTSFSLCLIDAGEARTVLMLHQCTIQAQLGNLLLATASKLLLWGRLFLCLKIGSCVMMPLLCFWMKELDCQPHLETEAWFGLRSLFSAP